MEGKKTKVLFLIHTLQVGGAEKVLINLVNSMDSEKFDITVMTVINTGAFRFELNDNIKYKTIFNINFLNKNKKTENKKSGNLLDNTNFVKKVAVKIYQFFWKIVDCKKIYKRYIKESYDVEVAFLEGISAKIISNSTNANSKKIAWIHVDLINETKTEKFFKNSKEERKVYSAYEKIICVSKYVKEQFIKKMGFDESKVKVLYNPVDTQKIIEIANEKVEDISKKRYTICSVGRLSEQKGYDRLLRITKKLNGEKLDFELWIIGVGSEEENLKKYINENNIENVKLLGYKKNPYKYIKLADAFVCSSRAEGFSTAVSEAVILSKPVITTDCSGMREILGDSEYGIICKNTEEDLYISLRSFLEDKKMQKQYQTRVKDRVGIFDLKTNVRIIEENIIGEKNV